MEKKDSFLHVNYRVERLVEKGFVVLLAVLFFVAMTTQVWGMLPKAQDNSETIEEAIERLIGEHNEDGSAHLGATGSLGVHRSSGILDHLAGSIVADKLSPREVLIREQFANADAFTEDDGTVYASGYALTLLKSTGNTTKARAVSDVETYDKDAFFDRDVLFQFMHKFGSLSNTPQFDAYFGGGYSGAGVALGVRVVSDGATFFVKDGIGYTYSQKYLISTNVWHVYRAHFSMIEGKVRFYVDGDIAGEVAVSSIEPEEAVGLVFEHTGANGYNTLSYVSDLLFAHDI